MSEKNVIWPAEIEPDELVWVSPSQDKVWEVPLAVATTSARNAAADCIDGISPDDIFKYNEGRVGAANQLTLVANQLTLVLLADSNIPRDTLAEMAHSKSVGNFYNSLSRYRNKEREDVGFGRLAQKAREIYGFYIESERELSVLYDEKALLEKCFSGDEDGREAFVARFEAVVLEVLGELVDNESDRNVAYAYLARAASTFLEMSEDDIGALRGLDTSLTEDLREDFRKYWLLRPILRDNLEN